MSFKARAIGPVTIGVAIGSVVVLAVVVGLTVRLGVEIALVVVTAVALAAGGFALASHRARGRELRAVRAQVHELRRGRVAAEQLPGVVDQWVRKRVGEAEGRLGRASQSELHRAIQEELEGSLGERLAATELQAQEASFAASRLDDLRAALAAELTSDPRLAAKHRDPASAERIRTSGLFDVDWYTQQHREELPSDREPLQHYLDVGWRRGNDPAPFIDLEDLSERLLAAGREPLGLFLERESAGGLPTPGGPSAPLRAAEHAGDRELRWQYLLSGGFRIPNDFVLYRIIGNDLPPRHRPGQSLENLRFILDNEPDLPGCDKRWVLNRIVDRELEAQLMSLLDDHGRGYLHIPFEWREYGRIGWRFQDFPEPGFVYGPRSSERSPAAQARIVDHVYHDKNLYVMNNNGARNAALREGRRCARWVLPWDGNTFMTAEAWQELRNAIGARPHVPYVMVPMARIVDNGELARPGFRPDPTEEPQVVFRSDASEAFDANLRYGRRPKVEFLMRLGVPGTWESWAVEPWERAITRCRDQGRYQVASTVVRLSSGEPELEVDAARRGLRRIDAIKECIDELDVRLARSEFDPDTLLTVSPETIQAVRDRRVTATGDRPESMEGWLSAASSARRHALRARGDVVELDGRELLTCAVAWRMSGEAELLDLVLRALQQLVDDPDATTPAAVPGSHALVLDAARLVRVEGVLPRELEMALTERLQVSRMLAGAEMPRSWQVFDALALAVFADDVRGAISLTREAEDQFAAEQRQAPHRLQGAGEAEVLAITRRIAGWLHVAVAAVRSGTFIGEAPDRDSAIAELRSTLEMLLDRAGSGVPRDLLLPSIEDAVGPVPAAQGRPEPGEGARRRSAVETL